jgi:hypothetical protein
MVKSPPGLKPKNGCAGEGQQQLQTTDLPSYQKEYLHINKYSTESKKFRSGAPDGA